MVKTNFSVCMSVYRGDRAEHFALALESIFTQTLLPQEVVLVVDGPIPGSIDSVIDAYSHRDVPLKVVRLAKNSGHAVARQTGMEAALGEYIAIADSDDIAVPDRFERQMNYLDRHPETDVLGGQIEEFIDSTNNIVGRRLVPVDDAGVKSYMRDRCPMNMVTTVLKKSAAEKVGGFIDWYCEEDYYLWVRMALAGCQFANLPDVLMKVRVGREMYSRRGGWKYFKSEARLQKYMYRNGIMGGVISS